MSQKSIDDAVDKIKSAWNQQAKPRVEFRADLFDAGGTYTEVTTALVNRIATTKKTDIETFANTQNYITAASHLLKSQIPDIDSKLGILFVQLLALELAHVVPGMIKSILPEVLENLENNK